MIIKNANVRVINRNGTLLFTIESSEKINSNDLIGLNGKMNITLFASKDANCPWQDEGKCTKGYHLGETIRLWWSKRPCVCECP